MLKFERLISQVRCSFFKTDQGSTEYYITISPKSGINFQNELDQLYSSYVEVLQHYGLNDETQIYSRLHLSDIVNQKDKLDKSDLINQLSKAGCSFIQQEPMDDNKVCLLSYHIKSQGAPFKREFFQLEPSSGHNGILLQGNNYSLLYTANFSGSGAFDSKTQSDKIFNSINSILKQKEMTLNDNAIRTWIYVRDIDNHYQGMVQSRLDFFNQNGLTDKTRYLASTGIEGSFDKSDSLVLVDSLSFGNLKKEQIVKMEALDNLSPTIRYGVTFERGIRVDFGDRSHFYLSGTASISDKGELLYPGDVKKQTERMLDNFKSLLTPHKVDLNDMAFIMVYLRDPSDKKTILEIIQKEFSDKVPFLFVKAPVCRPGWLVEIEGIGIKRNETKFNAFI